jgi:hypothetical protein
MTLIGDSAPVAGIGTRTERGDDAGRWRCLLLTANHVVYAEATREGDSDYDLGSHNQGATSLLAQRWRRDQVARVEVNEARTFGRDYGTSWVWDAKVALVMSDGTRLLLPPDADYASGGSDDAFRAILSELQDA